MRRLLLLAALVAACDDGSEIEPGKGRVEGRLTVFSGTLSGGLWQGRVAVPPPEVRAKLPDVKAVLRANSREALKWSGAREIVPGEVIVRFEERLAPADALRLVARDGLRTEHRGFASAWLHLVRFTDEKGAPVAAGRTDALARAIAGLDGVRYAEANVLQHAAAIPDDRGYSYQWHYPAMNLPAAWDVTKGSSSVVVAVVDTGGTPHPDLDARTVDGIDLISDEDRAQDGDGRDDDPTDQGKDQPQDRSSWHGTHVAGTVGAATNNDIGVAGVDWNARLVHVRVLGKGGGTRFDIAAGMTWAVGDEVPGVRRNEHPAKVVNLSLGGGGSEPSDVYQEVIDAGVAKGSVFVVAAGNSDEDAAQTTPCNQKNVICVGATRHSGTRASYSNYGAPLDVMAPGGELDEDANADGTPDGIVSTYRTQDGEPSIELNQGTSMATPHVAGLVALMKAVRPALTQAEAERILTSTASASSKCSEGCGAGLVNAHAAVLAAKGEAASGPAKLSLSTSELLLDGTANGSVTIANTGGQRLNVTVSASGPLASRVSFPKGAQLAVEPGRAGALELAADVAGLAAGVHTVGVRVASNGGSANLNVRLAPPATDGRDAVLAIVFEDDAGEWQAAGGGEVKAANRYGWQFDVPPGHYFVLAAVDEDGDGEYFEEGEPAGFYRSMSEPLDVVVEEGKVTGEIEFALAPLGDLGGAPRGPVGDACGSHASCGDGGACVTDWPGGYCTRSCDSAACPAGSACYGNPGEQVCLATCSDPGAGRGDCRGGYVCQDDFAGGAFCIPGCASDPDCGDGYSCEGGYCVDDGTPAELVVGDWCTDDADCPDDGFCDTTIEGGYCTRSCATRDCPADSDCYGEGEDAVCIATCSTPDEGQGECRDGLTCQSDSAGDGICLP